MSIELVLGARRSGKSERAEVRASALGVRTYIATASTRALEPERLALHRARRAGRFVTLEPKEPDELVGLVRSVPGGVLVDGLGLWVGWHLTSGREVDRDGLVAAVAARRAPTIVVSDEVGWSVHPESALARRFVDELGQLNQALASVASRVTLIVAGVELVLKGGS